jgi:hypothetical protein
MAEGKIEAVIRPPEFVLPTCPDPEDGHLEAGPKPDFPPGIPPDSHEILTSKGGSRGQRIQEGTFKAEGSLPEEQALADGLEAEVSGGEEAPGRGLPHAGDELTLPWFEAWSLLAQGH